MSKDPVDEVQNQSTTDESLDPIASSKHLKKTIESLQDTLKQYNNLFKSQHKESRILRAELEEIKNQQGQTSVIESKLKDLSRIMDRIQGSLEQFTSNSGEEYASSFASLSKVLGDEKISSIIKHEASQIDIEISGLNTVIEQLVERIDDQETEIFDRDMGIGQLNEIITQLNEEKDRLIAEIERLNFSLDNWRQQLDIYTRLATSDPRFQILSNISKHGSLSEIQLAFMISVPITIVKEHLSHLEELNLVRLSDNLVYLTHETDNLDFD
ncbi:MAG: hypothetical protein KAR35_10390 [Candidatus Heimdallarchaeota archaeon]|nr:hypothetical protein [Candidatus Heimdallarchaeota archaeon]MCK5049765.1 hypothetical protein [Candidatus Heimdallarchaeota archaeon]